MGVQTVRLDNPYTFGNASTTAPVFPIIASGFIANGLAASETEQYTDVTVTLPDNETVVLNGIACGAVIPLKCRSVSGGKGTIVYLF